MCIHYLFYNNIRAYIYFTVEDMIKEVDVDGDGRIDFYGKPVAVVSLLYRNKSQHVEFHFL